MTVLVEGIDKLKKKSITLLGQNKTVELQSLHISKWGGRKKQ
jgi:hypothetical protein